MAPSPDSIEAASVIVLHGNDEFRVEERARSLLNLRCPDAAQDGSLTTVRGDVDTIEPAVEALKEVILSVQSSNLFNPLNVTWFREVSFLTGKVFQNEEVKELLESLQEIVEAGLQSGQLLLITVSGKMSAASRFGKVMKAAAVVEEFQKTTKEWEVTGEAMQQVSAEADRLNVTFSHDALSELAERVGNDTRRIRNEVLKLSLCRGDGKVEKEDVERLVPLQQEAQAWKLSDCIGARDLPGAMCLLQRMETQGANPVAAMAMLHNSLREMAYLGACIHQGDARLQEKGRFGSFLFTDPEAEAGFQHITGDKKRSPHRMYLLGRQGRGFPVRQLDRILRLSAETYDGFFRRPLSHYEQLRLLLLRIFHECGPRQA